MICCDGTWNRPDSAHVTNVEKIARTVETDLRPHPRRAADGALPQRRRRRRPTRSTGCSAARSASGCSQRPLRPTGSSRSTTTPGDEIFVFGFSRGAYTARSLVGMIGRVGLLTRDALVRRQAPGGRSPATAPAPGRALASAVPATSEFQHRFTATHRHGHLARGVRHRRRARGARAPYAAPPVPRREPQPGRAVRPPGAGRRRAPAEVRARRLWEAADDPRRPTSDRPASSRCGSRACTPTSAAATPRPGCRDTALLWMVGGGPGEGAGLRRAPARDVRRQRQPAVRHDSLTVDRTGCSTCSRGSDGADPPRPALRPAAGAGSDPPPDPTQPERAVGVRISSTAVARFPGDPTYHHPQPRRVRPGPRLRRPRGVGRAAARGA